MNFVDVVLASHPVFVTSLPNVRKSGRPFAMVAKTPEEIEQFIARHDRAGFGQFFAPARLKDGATRRSTDTFEETEWLWGDVDFKDHKLSPKEIQRRLGQSPTPPLVIVFSGHGFQLFWRLKEPEQDQDKVVEALKLACQHVGGDRQVCEPVRLMRLPNSHNTKFGDYIQVDVTYCIDAHYDIDDLIETWQEVRPVLPEPVKADLHGDGGSNGHTTHDGFEDSGPLDVDACLASMQPNGASVNDVQPRVILSLLQKGYHPDDIRDLVVAHTMTMADDAGLEWDRDVEIAEVTKRIVSGLNKLHREYDPDTGVIPSWLPGEFHEDWTAGLVAGGRPQLSRNAYGWYVRVWKRQQKEDTPGDRAQPETEAAAVKEPRFRLQSFRDLHPGMEEQDYLIDELLPAQGLLVVWGKFKCLKTFLTYDMMFHVAKGWEYRDRAVRQGLVVYCAFEGAHGFRKRTEALRVHYEIPADEDVPLYVMPCQTNLAKDHTALIRDIRGQLGEGNNPAVIVLDTLNRSLVGSESKDVDMAGYIAAANAIKEAFKCLVIIVHHCGWDETRPRGHSSLPGAIDGQIAVVRDGDHVTMLVEFLRDGPEGAEIHSVTELVVVGDGANGKPLTSLVVNPSETAARGGARHWPRSLIIFRQAMTTALKTHGERFCEDSFAQEVRAVDLEAIREEFYATYTGKGETEHQRQDTRKKAFQRCVERAQAVGLVKIRNLPSRHTMAWFGGTDTTQQDEGT